MDTRIVPGGSSIGNAESTAKTFAPGGPVFPGSPDTTGPAIARPRANAEADSRGTLLRMAEEWFRAGCAVHPAKPDGSKVPKAWRGGGPGGAYGWKRFSTGELDRLAINDVLRQCREAVDGIGVFCGQASGGLEMLELEGRAVELLDVIAARAEERGLGELWRRIDGGCSDTSPSGGVHWYIRVADGPTLGNVKLALRPGPGGDVKNPDTVAETRGSGGWVVVAGSFGRTHGSGRPYVMRTGSPASIATVTVAERDAIYAVFRTLDELPAITNPEPRKVAKKERPEGTVFPGDDFDQRATWADVFPSPWARISEGQSRDEWSKHGSNGRKSADVFHESDTVYIYATGVPGCGKSLGKFGAYSWLHHNGDFRAAASALYALGYGSRLESKTGGRSRETPPVRIEPLEPVAELIPIDQYRRDLQQAIAESVLDGSPGVKLLRGAPGCGKTTAVLRAVARYGRGVVSVPSHELAAEVVEKLQEAGADAAAYPKLDESTCQNYAAACRARARGLSVAASVCPTCPLLRECRESGYVAGVKRASEARHQVVTHSRFARSAGKLTKRADYVVLEEDPTAALRPTATATRRELHRLSDLADVYADAERRARILDGSDLVVADVEPLAEFAAFAPDEQGEPGEGNGDIVTISAGDGGGQVTARYLRESEPPAPRRTYPRGFFGSLCRIADELAAGITAAIVDEQGPAVRELHVKPCSDPPKNPDGSVWRALEMIDRVDPDGTAGISEECLRLVVAVATGRVRSLYVQIDTDARPGAPDRRSASVVGIWQTGILFLDRPVYVNDGTLDIETLRRIVCGHPDFYDMVSDITPPGSAPVLHASIQYAADILPTTSSAKVAAILTGIARANPDRERLGVVLHQRHYRALLEAEQSPLPCDVRSRIAWATYFGSGADRGTNTLHQVADLAVVIGTHRPPPSEIRRTLLRWGELEAASGSATWGAVDRHAVGPDGAAVEYVGRGYGELAWARAADACTRAAMRQAVGRARAITPDGVPVVAVTTESTGLPVAPADALPVADLRLDLVLAAVAGAVAQSVKMGNSEPAIGAEYRAENPIDRYRENCAILPGGSVSVDEVEKRLPGVSSRSVQVWLREAIDAGLVVRTGAARATRYGLAGPAPAALAVEPASSTPVVVTITPVAAPVVEPARPLVAEKPASRPVVAPAVEPKPLSLARISPPPVVAEKPPASDWLDVVLSPERHPDDVLSLRFYLDGPYANDVGQGNVWASDVTPGLVAKLHTTATAEAKRRGQPPPPIDLVARHTSAWFSVAAAG